MATKTCRICNCGLTTENKVPNRRMCKTCYRVFNAENVATYTRITKCRNLVLMHGIDRALYLAERKVAAAQAELDTILAIKNGELKPL